MKKSAKSRAEEQFARIRNTEQDKKVLRDREKAENERAAHVARLRGLRLAKEAADKEATAKAAAEAQAAKASRPRKTAAAPDAKPTG